MMKKLKNFANICNLTKREKYIFLQDCRRKPYESSHLQWILVRRHVGWMNIDYNVDVHIS